MSESPDSPRPNTPTPPEGVPSERHVGVTPGPRHMGEATGHDNEPSDLLGYLSLGLGLIALLMTPVAMTPISISLVAFCVVSIICGAIRLLDKRFAQHSDAAIGGMVSSLVVLATIAIMTFAGVASDLAEECDVPFFGCETVSQDDWADRDPRLFVHDHHRRNDTDDIEELDVDDYETDGEYEDEDHTDSDDVSHSESDIDDDEVLQEMEKVGRNIDEFFGSDANSGDESDKEPSFDNPEEQETSKEPSDETIIKRIPLADEDGTKMKQVPLSKSTSDTMHQA